MEAACRARLGDGDVGEWFGLKYGEVEAPPARGTGDTEGETSRDVPPCPLRLPECSGSGVGFFASLVTRRFLPEGLPPPPPPPPPPPFFFGGGFGLCFRTSGDCEGERERARD